MTKSTKIIIAVIGSVLAVCIVITAVVSIKTAKNDSGDTTQPSDAFGQVTSSSQTESNTVLTLQDALIGKWMDSAQMSGYEFFGDGRVTVTYVNLTVPVLNMPINGTSTGSYSVDGNIVTVSYSIYKGTITDSFTAKVENDTLTLVSLNDGKTATYRRQTQAQSSIPAQQGSSSGTQVVANSVEGSWVNSDGSIRYVFNKDGTVKVTYKGAVVRDISSDPISGSFNGVYMTQDDDLTVQFTVNEKKITEKYTYKISGNSLSLSKSIFSTEIFSRDLSTDISSLIGTWFDSGKMSGYTFRDDGKVTITYVNFTIPVINMPINGSYEGAYTVDGDRITISSTIYSKSVVNTYTFEVVNSTLTLRNVENGETITYIRS